MEKITDINQIYASCLREYMSDIDRTNRSYKTQEIFTPYEMVDFILSEIDIKKEINSVFLDRAVGDGQFAAKILIAKIKNRINYGTPIHDAFVASLDEIFGVDIERENVILCRERLLCGCSDPNIIALVNKRIIVGDSLNPNKKIKDQSNEDFLLMQKYFSVPNLFE